MIQRIIKSIARLFNPPKFIVQIDNRKAEVVKGKLSKAFLEDCSIICDDNEIDAGKIYGIEKEYGVSLDFSHTIPDSCHQKFRNVWGIHK